MDGQCVPPSVWESELTIGVQGFWTGRDDGIKSEGKIKNYVTHSTKNLSGVHFLNLFGNLRTNFLGLCCHIQGSAGT